MNYFKFDDEVHDYQKFVRDNIKFLGNLMLISEQLYIKNPKSYIDMLALDLSEKKLVILELKNTIAKDLVGQPLRYYDFLLRAEDDLKDLIKQVKQKIPFNIEEIDYIPNVLLVVPDFDNQRLRSLTYVQDIDIKIIKLNAIQNNNFFEILKEEYVPQSSYLKDDLIEVNGKISKDWNFNEYLNEGINENKINLARNFIYYIQNEFNKQNKTIKTYFSDKKISIMVENKNWGSIFIKKEIFNDSLDISVNLPKEKKIMSNDLLYNNCISDFKILERVIKIRFIKIPIDFLKKII